jgi:hypothetical protein
VRAFAAHVATLQRSVAAAAAIAPGHQTAGEPLTATGDDLARRLRSLGPCRVVDDPAAAAAQFGVALWQELGCDAGAGNVVTKVLADRLT